MRVPTYLAARVALIVALSVTVVRADIVAFDFSAAGGGPVIGTTTDEDFGIEFTPLSNIIVTTLLIWDISSNDFATFDGDVAIWNVAAPSVPVVAGAITAAGSSTEASASSSGIWRVADVPDTLLLSGVTYRLAADGFDLDGAFPAVTPVLNGIALTTTTSHFESDSDTAGPDYPDLAIMSSFAPVGSASFTYVAIPEPRALLLLGMVAVGAVGRCYLFRLKQRFGNAS
jgi:hypothetical protein